MIKKLIYIVGQLKYNKKINLEYNKLKESEMYSLKKLENIQVEKLQELLEFAFENSQYYKEKFSAHGIETVQINDLSDLSNFPFLNKEELRNNSRAIQVEKYKNEKYYYSETSGSTGEPLVFYRNQTWDAVHRASILRGYSWYGVKPYEKNGYLWGYNIDKKKTTKIKILDFLQNRTRIFTYNDEKLEEFLRKMQSSTYIEGYSSMIYEMAKKVNSDEKYDYSFPELKMVKGTSEKIFDTYKTEVKKAFGLNFTSEYGAAEAGIIAFECPYGNMHITMENVIVECINGEIVVTNLSSHSFPIIRYKLGDYIELESQSYQCECGREHPIIKSVLGRVGRTIKGVKSNYPSLTLYYVFKNLAEKNYKLYYQAIQNEKGKLQLNIEQKLSEVEKTLLEVEIDKYFKKDLEVIIKDNVQLDRGDGKMRDFISSLD